VREEEEQIPREWARGRVLIERKSDAKSHEDDQVTSVSCDPRLSSVNLLKATGACQLRAVATIKSRRRWRTTRITRRTGRRTWSCYRCQQRHPRHRRRPRRRLEASMMSSRSCRSPTTLRAVYGASGVRPCRSSPTRRHTCFSTVYLAAYFPPVMPISMVPSRPLKRDLKYPRKRRVRILLYLNTIYSLYVKLKNFIYISIDAFL